MNDLIRPGTLTEILFRSRMVTEADVLRVLDEQKRVGGRMGELFVDMGIVTQEDIDWALSNHLDIPFVRLDRRAIDADSVRCVPAGLARRHGLIPLLRIGDEISVAMIDPLDKEAVREVEAATGCTVTVSISRAHEVREMQRLFYGGEVDGTLGLESALCPRAALASINADPTGGALADWLVGRLVEERWDALVGRPGEDGATLCARTGGVLREVGRLPREGYAALTHRLRGMCGIGDDGEPAAEGTFASSEGGQAFRALFLSAASGDCLTLTRKSLSPFPVSIDGFNASGDTLGSFGELAASRRGIVLFCGRDGEARARLVDLFLERADTSGRHVVLFGGAAGRGGAGRFPRIRVDFRRGAESAALLAAALEHEPDVVAIDDVSDGRLFAAAGKAAMRGKLVLAGLPIDDRPTLFRHLAALWGRHAFLPALLRGGVSCRDVLTLCPSCREPFAPEPDVVASLGLSAPPDRFYRAAGCEACNHTGQGDRRWLLDAVPVTRELLEVFESSRYGEEAVGYLERIGRGGLAEEGRKLLLAGEISPDEYLASFVL
jgi:type II secretory ATPase GspE/PulE/Tfp pilus assembly ATPase PilB-like protein